MKGTGTRPRANIQPRYNDRLQDHIQQLVNRSFAAMKRPTGGGTPSGTVSGAPAGRARRIQDIDDETLVRGLTDPIIFYLDEGHQRPARTLNSLDDDELARALTNPKALDLR